MANDKIKGLSLAIGGDTGGLAKSLDEINKQSRTLQGDLKTVEKLLKLDPTNTVLLAQKQDLLSKSVEITKEKLQELEKSEEAVQKAFNEKKIDQTQFVEFQKELVNTRKKLEDLQAQEKEAKEKTSDLGNETQNTKKDIKNLGDEARNTRKDTKDLGQETQETKKNIKDLGDQSLKSGDIMKESLKAEAIVGGLKAIGNEIKDVSKAAISVGSDFEASMSQVAATMGMTKEDVQGGATDYKKLEKAAADMGASTKYTSAEAADALNYLALAGYDANKAVETLPKILTIAQAGGMDLATTSDLVTDSMGALQLSTDDLDNYVDQLAKTSQKSNTNVQQLGEGLLVVAGTSVSTGQDLSKVNTALGILANNGLKGSEGGTKLRNILLALTAPTDKAAKKIDELGLSVTDSTGKIRDIDDIMSDLNKTLSRMSESERTQVLNEIFNKQDLSGVSSLLESTNGEFKNLYDNIVDSNGAAADMADTMNDNLKGRMAEVRSALEAVGIAAYKKFETPLKNAAKKSSKEFSEFADSINDGELSESFEDLGDNFATFVDVGLEAVEFVIPPLTKGLGWILEHSPVIIGGLSGIASAMITQKTVTTVVNTANAFSDMAQAINTAKTAQATFNAVSSATPWGAIATVVGLAIGGIVTFGLEAKTTEKKINNLSDEQKTLIERTQNLNKEISESAETRKNNIDDIETTYDGYKNMVEKLYDLNEAENLSVGQKEKMKGMVDELNKAIPDLNLQLNEETGHLENQKEAIVQLIEKTKEQMKLDAVKEDLVGLYKEQAKAEKNVALSKQEYIELKEKENECDKKLSDNRKKLQEESAKLNKEQINGLMPLNQSYIDAADKQKKLQKEYDETKNSVAEMKKNWDDAEDSLESVNNDVKDSENYVNDLATTIEKTAETAEVATEKMKITVGKYKGQTVEVVSTAVEEIQKLESEYQEAYQKRSQELQDSLDVFKEFSLNSEITADKLLNNMESNLEGMTNWADGLNTLAKRGLDEGLIQKLRDAGPSSASEVAAMTKMTDEQLEKYNKDWRTYTNKIQGIVSEELQDAREEINQKVSTAIKDVEKKQPAASSAGKKVGSAIGNSINSGYDSAKASDHIKGDIEKLITDVHNDYKQKLYNGFYEMGSFIDEGLAAGLRDNTYRSTYATEVLGNSVLYTGNKTFGINSPSKKFYEIGDYCVQGQVLGMQDREKELFAEIDNINYGILDRAQNISLGDTLNIANQSARQLIGNSDTPIKKVDEYNTSEKSDTFNFNFTFNGVTMSNDQDLEEMADKLMYIMEQKVRRREAVFK